MKTRILFAVMAAAALAMTGCRSAQNTSAEGCCGNCSEVKEVSAGTVSAKADGTKKECCGSKACSGKTEAAAMPVNAFCVMMPDHPVDKTVTTKFQGETVGFCCSDCVSEFDAKTDAVKAELLTAAKAKKQ